MTPNRFRPSPNSHTVTHMPRSENVHACKAQTDAANDCQTSASPRHIEGDNSGERQRITYVLSTGTYWKSGGFHDFSPTDSGRLTALDGVPAHPVDPSLTCDAVQFWRHVDRSAGVGACWPWVGTCFVKGYGRFSADGRTQGIHRIAYRYVVGPIPEGLQLDHLCRNRACGNPAHLEPVTGAENSRRGSGYARKVACKRGHPYAGNRNARGACRVCQAQHESARRRRVSALRGAA